MRNEPAPRIAYLVSQYPATSHTFIRREIAHLRSQGLEVDTFSVRRARVEALVSDADRREAESTHSILPTSLKKLATAHGRTLLRHPDRYLQVLRQAVRNRVPGSRALVWSLFHFGEAMLLVDELRERGATRVHTHFANAGAQVSLLAAAYLKLPWSLTLHGPSDYEYPSSELLAHMVDAADFVACISHYGRSQAMLRVPSRLWEKLHMVRCGLDTVELQRVAPKSRDTEGPVRLLCVARLDRQKALEGLVEAVGEVVDSNVDLQLRLVGAGPDQAALRSYIRVRGLTGRIKLLGPLGGRDLWSEFLGADMFAMSSLMEGLPVVLMEAMTLGLPVIAPRVAGIPELVVDEETGLLYHPSDWSGLAACIRRLAADEDLRSRLAARARDKVTVQHGVEVACEPLLRLLTSSARDGEAAQVDVIAPQPTHSSVQPPLPTAATASAVQSSISAPEVSVPTDAGPVPDTTGTPELVPAR